MNHRAAILVLAATALVAALLFATGHACEGVRSMSIEGACTAASTDPRMHALCLRALRTSSPPDTKLSTYAAAAARSAALSCDGTARTISVMLQGGSIPKGRQRTMLSGCYGDMRAACVAMAAVLGQLRRCDFAPHRQGYGEAVVAIDHCIAKLDSLGAGPDVVAQLGRR